MKSTLQAPVVIVGSGLAGMMTALRLAPLPVLLLTQGKLGVETSSIYAQGGIAAACREEEKDSSAHVQDTLKAGAGLCDPQVVETLLAEGEQAIETLKAYGVVFDKNADGKPVLGLEGAHSHRRIFHIHGDATGRGIVEALSKAVLRTPFIQRLENATALRLCKAGGKITGLVADIGGKPVVIASPTIVLATGGIGGLFMESTNPPSNFGQGLILAAEAGAEMADLEFIQFHPTALALDRDIFPRILISEAVRGEGAILVNEKGQRFLEQVEGQELAPRDVVARAIHHEISRGGKVFLDATQAGYDQRAGFDKSIEYDQQQGKALGTGFAKRFPSLDRFCKENGIDPAIDLIPVKPVEHFHMGGVKTDMEGRTSLAGLWAVGEVASTGLHGANRLASNSLLEATLMGMRAAHAIKENRVVDVPEEMQPIEADIPEIATSLPEVKTLMQHHLNIIRDGVSLRQGIAKLLPMAQEETTMNPAKLALMIAVSALLRKESRGGHYRQDFSEISEKPVRSFLTLSQTFAYAQQIEA